MKRNVGSPPITWPQVKVLHAVKDDEVFFDAKSRMWRGEYLQRVSKQVEILDRLGLITVAGEKVTLTQGGLDMLEELKQYSG